MFAPEPEGFVEYVAAGRAALLRTAYLLTGQHDDAEDLVQVALVKAVPRWRRISDDPEPYVRRILLNENISRWRGRRWREHPADVLPESAVADPDLDRREVMRRALLQLAPRQRAVVVLRYYDDLTERQTAELLGIRVGTVKSQSRDALTRLRDLVGFDLAAGGHEREAVVERGR